MLSDSTTVKGGRFIVLEGGEGVGKSTLLKHLARELQAQGKQVVVTREPGGTELGEALRELLLDPGTGRISPQSELLMMFAARAQHLEQVIRPALEQGCWVLCDRFADASFAYQGAGRGVPHEFIASLEQFVVARCEPDCVLILDAPPQVGLARVGKDRDRFEREGVGFFERVRQSYLERAQNNPERYRVLDATQDKDAVCRSAEKALLPWTHPSAATPSTGP